MRTSYQNIMKYIKTDFSANELAKKLTQQGLEIEEQIPYAYGLDGIIIAQVKTKIPHPNADHLFLCSVDTGFNTLKIVCGAKNFLVGDKVPLAPVGTIMPSGIEIKLSKIRGEESEGMLCSSKELGLFDSEGLWILPKDAPLGIPLLQYTHIDPDTIYDIAVTPNRGDCLGTFGIAREVAVLAKTNASSLHKENPNFSIDQSIKSPEVKIESSDCLRYTSRIIKDVQVEESPLWLKIALKKYGVNSINNLVDISNLIMMEYGQPVHIYDYDKLSLPLVIKPSQKNESIILLSKEELTLPENLLLISDQKTNLVLAGVMGGLESGVSYTTTNILLEVAYFTPDSIRNTIKNLNIHTDASYRFTRNTDIHATIDIIEFLTHYVLKVSSGSVSPITDVYPIKKELITIHTSLKEITKKLGFDIPKQDIENILTYLNFEYTIKNEQDYSIIVPSYRNDCSIPEDIIEEIIRVYGYDKMPATVPTLNQPLDKKLSSTPLIFSIKELLVSYGIQEIYTFSLTKKETNQEYSLLPSENNIPLQNPLNISLSYLRTSLLSTIAPYIQSLLERGIKSFHGFEVGNIFFENDHKEYKEETHLCLFQLGDTFPTNFKTPHTLVDFYSTKTILEKLLTHLGIIKDISFTIAEDIHFLHPHRSAKIYYLEEYIGYIGEIHPQFWNNYKTKNQLIIAEINTLFMTRGNENKTQQLQRTYKPINKYPKVERDLAFILDISITAGEIIKYWESLSDLIISIHAVDSYIHSKFGENKRSLGFRIFFQSSDHTLTDQEIEPIIHSMINWVVQEKQGVLREF